MKIAFTSVGTSWDSLIDPRFGRTENILLYDEESKELFTVDNGAVKNDAHGAGTATAQKDIRAETRYTYYRKRSWRKCS